MRATIVALPIIPEEGNKPNISKVKDIPHASGHDGHTAILLATAEWFLFIIQLAEEIMPSGTDRFVKMGVLEGGEANFGIQLWQSMDGEEGLESRRLRQWLKNIANNPNDSGTALESFF
ncbi:hypothetical protein [Peribacillus sp. FSL E2-0218]|uniref:hypothetical protein n=1 Tax=Peribacillus sp. FSL E2-0218 TaxID=2921364 RepID=UPI0030EE05B9